MNFMEQNISETIESNFMPYAMSVIISRAIPEIDGLKPSHRKLLYTMYKMKLLSGDRTKSSNIVGQTMKLNPHGDQAIYATMVRLTRGNEALLHPLVDSKGSFGKVYSRDTSPAAARYTEAKLDKIAEEFFKDIDKDTVDFMDNFDGSMQEPVLLPVTFPNILVNPNLGIAVGMASNICSFNLKEVCDTTVNFIKHPGCDVAKTLLAPDFPTGGQLIYNEDEIRKIYETGRGSFKVRAKYSFDKKNHCIDVTEIPYTTTAEIIIDKIAELVKSGKIKEINDVRDETDLNGLKITIDVKKNTDVEKLVSKLFKLTTMEDSFGCNFNVLMGHNPVVTGIKGILEEWTEFRRECLRRSYTYDVERMKEKLHLLYGLARILLDIDKAVRIVRETEMEKDVIPNLMAGFDIDEIQAEYVAEIKLRNLNREYILKRTGETDDLEKSIDEYESILNSPDKINDVICKQLKEVAKKYGKDRKTEIIHGDDVVEYSEERYIEDYPVKLFLSEEGYFKKISLQALRTSGEQKLKEDDRIKTELETTNKADILLFSDRQNVYKAHIYDMPDGKASLLGDYLPNLLSMEDGEKIIGMTATSDYSGHVLFAFENGKMAKIPLVSYETKTNRKQLKNAYSDASPLVDMKFFTEDVELAAFSSNGKVLVFDTSMVSEKTTKSSQGVSVLLSKKGSRLIDLREVSELSFSDPKYYRTKNIPAMGCFIRKGDAIEEQISFV